MVAGTKSDVQYLEKYCGIEINNILSLSQLETRFRHTEFDIIIGSRPDNDISHLAKYLAAGGRLATLASAGVGQQPKILKSSGSFTNVDVEILLQKKPHIWKL